jgi:hypothetical protein
VLSEGAVEFSTGGDYFRASVPIHVQDRLRESLGQNAEAHLELHPGGGELAPAAGPAVVAREATLCHPATTFDVQARLVLGLDVVLTVTSPRWPVRPILAERGYCR